MDEQKIAKKIVSYLDEMPLDKSIEDRLAIARNQALLKAKNKQFLEIEAGPTLAVKKKGAIGNQLIHWSLITGLLVCALALQNPIKEQFFPNKERVTLASPDFEDFLGTTYQRSQEFQVWDNEMDKLLKD